MLKPKPRVLWVCPDIHPIGQTALHLGDSLTLTWDRIDLEADRFIIEASLGKSWYRGHHRAAEDVQLAMSGGHGRRH